jgi:hypothetical protein
MDDQRRTAGISPLRAVVVVAVCGVALAGVWFRHNDIALAMVFVGGILLVAIRPRPQPRRALAPPKRLSATPDPAAACAAAITFDHTETMFDGVGEVRRWSCSSCSSS